MFTTGNTFDTLNIWISDWRAWIALQLLFRTEVMLRLINIISQIDYSIVFDSVVGFDTPQKDRESKYNHTSITPLSFPQTSFNPKENRDRFKKNLIQYTPKILHTWGVSQ
jgi:hypothetical protein